MPGRRLQHSSIRADRLANRLSECNEVRADLDLVGQGAMDGALLCDLEQLISLCFVQYSDQFDAAQNAIDLRLRVFTVDTVIGVHSFMPKPHDDLVECPFFPSREYIDCHRGATAERHQEQLVGARPGIASAGRDGLVGTQRVPPVEQSLLEGAGASRRHDD